MQALNVKFVKQLGAYVEENAFVDLSPAFPDYARYLADMEAKHGRPTAMLPPVALPNSNGKVHLRPHRPLLLCYREW